MNDETANNEANTSLNTLHWHPQQKVLICLCNMLLVEGLLKSTDFIWNEGTVLRHRDPAKELEQLSH